MVGVVGAQGQLTQGAILRNPITKYKRSKNVFSITPIALIFDRLFPLFSLALLPSLSPFYVCEPHSPQFWTSSLITFSNYRHA